MQSIPVEHVPLIFKESVEMNDIDRILMEASKDPTNMSVLEFGSLESIVGTKTRTVSMVPSSLETLR